MRWHQVPLSVWHSTILLTTPGKVLKIIVLLPKREIRWVGGKEMSSENFFFLIHRNSSMALKPRLIRNLSPPTEIQVLLAAGVGGVPAQRNNIRLNHKPIIYNFVFIYLHKFCWIIFLWGENWV